MIQLKRKHVVTWTLLFAGSGSTCPKFGSITLTRSESTWPIASFPTSGICNMLM
jgi:hypothetical protein